jgi:microcystin-dependent protein
MPQTVNKGYEIQNTGANVGTWGSVLNTAALSVIDKNLGGILSIGLTNANVTLSTTDAQNGIIRLTGILTGNVIVTFPGVGSFYIIENVTTGNFSIVLSNGVGGSVIPPRNTRSFIATDATNGVRFAGQSSLPPGTIIDYAGSTVSASITGSEFLVCDGSAVSRTTFSALFAAIDVLWGVGDGSTTFNVPNLVGRTRAMIDAGGSVLSGATTVGSALGAQSITISQANLPAVTLAGTTSSDGAHTHTVNDAIFKGSSAGGGGVNQIWTGNTTVATSSAGTHTHTVSVPLGGSGTSISNAQPTAIVYCLIKT